MPSNATITAFYTFQPYSKARASQLNANFGNLRGHLLPINIDTATASDQTYSLGSSEYRWRHGYFSGISTSISIGSSHILRGTTAGGFKWEKDSVTTAEITGNVITGVNYTPIGLTSSGGVGSFSRSASINTSTTASGNISGSTCTLQTTGRPVLYGLINVADTSGVSGVSRAQFSDSLPSKYILGFLVNGSTAGSVELGAPNGTAAGVRYHNSACIFWNILELSSGSHSFSLYVNANPAGKASPPSVSIQNCQVFAVEL